MASSSLTRWHRPGGLRILAHHSGVVISIQVTLHGEQTRRTRCDEVGYHRCCLNDDDWWGASARIISGSVQEHGKIKSRTSDTATWSELASRARMHSYLVRLIRPRCRTHEESYFGEQVHISIEGEDNSGPRELAPPDEVHLPGEREEVVIGYQSFRSRTS